jgi:formate hydrogenlyase transcriptional activator
MSEFPGGRDLLELAVESSPTGMLVYDERGAILYVNRRIVDIFGFPPDELLGQPLDLLLDPPALSDDSRGAMRELVGRRKDGTAVPVEIGLAATQGESGGLVVASITDVSERRTKRQPSPYEIVTLERLVSDLAVAFVNVKPEELDVLIVDSQRRLVETLDLDRCILWQFTDDRQDLVTTHGWVRPQLAETLPGLSARAEYPWLMSRVRSNEIVWSTRIEDIPSAVDQASMRLHGTVSQALIPVSSGATVLGALSLTTMTKPRVWKTDVLERLGVVAAVIGQCLVRREDLRQLKDALGEVARLRDQLVSDNVQLRDEVKALRVAPRIAAGSPAMQRALELVASVAPTDASVLLHGETGCGKELFAQEVHRLSARKGHEMVRVNCAAIPTALIESELFGRERGAYTGALSRQAGRFEVADGTTIFLDEIGELPLDAQAKLLRVLQERTIERLGGTKSIPVDVRVIAATNRDLTKEIAERTFREDLFYRLNVFPITVPPLRDRVEDIPDLVWTFIDEFAGAFNKRIESISRDSLLTLQRYSWPGNVRELRNLIERAVIMANGPRLTVDPPVSIRAEPAENRSLHDVEATHIRSVLERVGWRVRGTGGAAELLEMNPTTLDSRMAKLGIRRPVRRVAKNA